MALFFFTALLPLDVLRLIFEYTTAEDKRTGTSLATVSKRVKRWVEPVLYSVVDLLRTRTKRLFLRTIETSTTKNATFFATRVKTLSIAYDPSSDDEQTTRIIHTCRGLQSLTFLSIYVRQHRIGADSCFHSFTGIVGEGHVTVPSFNSALSFHSVSTSGSFANDQTVLLLRKRKAVNLRVALSKLRPRHVSILFPISGPEVDISPLTQDKSSSDHYALPALPISLNMPLLSSTTRLSLQNRWEDWALWSRRLEFARLPSLTHLSLDLRAQISVPRSKTACGDERGPDSQVANRVCAQSRAIQCLLSQCPRLRVCILRLVFDSNPDMTAAAILAQMPLSPPSIQSYHAKYLAEAYWRTKGEESEREDGNDADVEDEDTKTTIPHMVDPRLVFVWDKEPFQHRDAESKKECQMWAKAEEAVKRQSEGLGHILLSV